MGLWTSLRFPLPCFPSPLRPFGPVQLLLSSLSSFVAAVLFFFVDLQFGSPVSWWQGPTSASTRAQLRHPQKRDITHSGFEMSLVQNYTGGSRFSQCCGVYMVEKSPWRARRSLEVHLDEKGPRGPGVLASLSNGCVDSRGLSFEFLSQTDRSRHATVLRSSF